MEYFELIDKMVKLQVLCARHIERNASLKIRKVIDMDRLLTGGKPTCTYVEGINNLLKNIEKYCEDDSELIESITCLKNEIEESDIKNLRFGLEPKLKFTELEKELNFRMVKRELFMTGEMVSIKDLCDILDLNETTVKQACQDNRLKNVRKIGKTWLVHIPECRSYWDIPYKEDSKCLNRNFIY